MHIDHLRYFVALNNFNSVTKASHFLNTTPQNVSRVLKKLETEMDTILVNRTPDGITLTSEGERFLQLAKTTIYQFDELQADIQLKKSDTYKHSEVVLFSNNVVNEIILNDILIAFYNQYPTIIVKNIIVDWKEGYDSINTNPSAIAFLYYLPEENQLENFVIIPALQAHPVAIISKNHPLAKKQQINLKEICNYKLILLTQNNVKDTEVFHYLNLQHFTQKISIASSGNLKSCYHLTANSDYICPGSLESFLRQDETIRKNLVAIPITGYISIMAALIKSKDLSQDSPQHLLFTFILNYLQKVKF